ncbi:DDB1-and CUL4-associated factor 6 [Trichonephila clavipes]|nr:DDB1-and CUL4-associated factor 6 [Trichonephila clavipes]
MPYGCTTPYHLFDAAKNSRELVQKLTLQRKIPVHDGCVNSICWNDTGKYLLSGSDDQRLSVVHGYDYSLARFDSLLDGVRGYTDSLDTLNTRGRSTFTYVH